MSSSELSFRRREAAPSRGSCRLPATLEWSSTHPVVSVRSYSVPLGFLVPKTLRSRRIGAAVVGDDKLANDFFVRNSRASRGILLAERFLPRRLWKAALYCPFLCFKVRVHLSIELVLHDFGRLLLVPRLVKESLGGFSARFG